MAQPAETALYEQSTRLLQSAGCPSHISSIYEISAGANNRVYRVDSAAGPFVLKYYFRHQDDMRDRLSAEFEFLEYAHRVSPDYVPRPMARFQQQGLALYEYLEGKPMSGAKVTKDDVDAAQAFFSALNDPQVRNEATALPASSEAAFSINEHLSILDRRIGDLQRLEPNDDVDRMLLALTQRIDTYWGQCKEKVLSRAEDLGWDCDALLPQAQRCISPSDFGFHNALRASDGRILFLDFEYAGWDDPAKTVADFFAQPAVPVPMRYFEPFLDAVMRPFGNAEELLLRTRLLQPVHRLKWCCIALNIFRPVHLARRKFADASVDETALKHTQLNKAEELFKKIKEADVGLH